MSSKVDIWNAALSNIGHKANIADPDEATVEANHCRRFYPMALRFALERFAWNFATRRVELAEVDNPVDHWAYAYALPNQCIAARAVLPPECTDDTLEQVFTIEAAEDGSAILYTNMEDAVLKYTTLVEDTNKFTPTFVIALSYDLAALLVGPIPKDPKKRQEMQRLAEYYTGMAQANNANASHMEPYGFTPAHLAAR
jgi:hypothetical protein